MFIPKKKKFEVGGGSLGLPTVRQIRAQCEVKFVIVLLVNEFIYFLYYNFDE